MKRVMFLSAVCLFLLSACSLDKVNIGGSKIQPSSTIEKKEYRQPSFSKVDVDVVANVKFIQIGRDGDCRVVLSCPDNYVDLFRFEVSDGELEVSFARDGVNIDARQVDITIYAPDLQSLENSGVASVEITRLNAYRLDVENSGVGSLYLSGLTVKDLKAECSGVGSIELKGTAEKAVLDCEGVGSIRAEGLKAAEVIAEVSGVGGVKCYASRRLTGEVSGVGSLKYGGSPQHKQLQRTGVGKISEL